MPTISKQLAFSGCSFQLPLGLITTLFSFVSTQYAMTPLIAFSCAFVAVVKCQDNSLVMLKMPGRDHFNKYNNFPTPVNNDTDPPHSSYQIDLPLGSRCHQLIVVWDVEFVHKTLNQKQLCHFHNSFFHISFDFATYIFV
jgi:hypothetical protein